MAAAALTRSRGVAGGLCFLFTLLCLVCLASSRIDNEKLKNIKEENQKIEQDLNNLKAKKATLSDFTREQMSSQEAMIAFAEKVSGLSPDDFLPLKEHLEKIKTYIDEKNELMDAQIADIELNLGSTKKCLQAVEEYQAEL